MRNPTFDQCEGSLSCSHHLNVLVDLGHFLHNRFHVKLNADQISASIVPTNLLQRAKAFEFACNLDRQPCREGFSFFHSVRGENHCTLAALLSDGFPQFAARPWIHPRRSLINQHQFGSANHGHRQNQFALVSTTESRSARIDKHGQIVETYDLVDHGVNLICRNADQSCIKGDCLLHGEIVIDAVRLGTVANESVLFFFTHNCLLQADIVDDYFTASKTLIAHNARKSWRFSGSIHSKKSKKFALFDAKRCSTDCLRNFDPSCLLSLSFVQLFNIWVHLFNCWQIVKVFDLRILVFANLWHIVLNEVFHDQNVRFWCFWHKFWLSSIDQRFFSNLIFLDTLWCFNTKIFFIIRIEIVSLKLTEHLIDTSFFFWNKWVCLDSIGRSRISMNHLSSAKSPICDNVDN